MYQIFVNIARITKNVNLRFSKTIGLGYICTIKPGVWVIDVLFNYKSEFLTLDLTKTKLFVKHGIYKVLWFGFIYYFLSKSEILFCFWDCSKVNKLVKRKYKYTGCLYKMNTLHSIYVEYIEKYI